MRHRLFAAVIVAAALIALVVSTAPVGAQAKTGAPAAAQGKSGPAKGTVPRTAWGKPDLEGTWDFRTITPLERPDNLAGKEFLTDEEAAKLEKSVVDRNTELDERPPQPVSAGGNVDRQADGSPGFYNNFWLDGGTKTVGTHRTSLITDPKDGKLPPMTDAARKRQEERRAYLRDHPADSYVDLAAANRCLVGFNAGPPLSPGGYNQNMLIVQTKDYVGLMTEMVHTVRMVPLDGRPRVSSNVRQWSGDARGHWEGDTLVIETSNFNPERAWRGTSDKMKLVERLTRVDANTLEYNYTVTDPETWTRPWTASTTLRRSEGALYEYACHEGNYSEGNILSGQRAIERKAAQKK
jgi:hypothetical protein